jgi:hypothetical protein
MTQDMGQDMGQDMAEPESAGLLRALGQARPPGPGVLTAAREALWSAVAEEMLSADAAGEPGAAREAGAGKADQPRRNTRGRTAEPGA